MGAVNEGRKLKAAEIRLLAVALRDEVGIRFPTVNYGGCAFAALSMFDAAGKYGLSRAILVPSKGFRHVAAIIGGATFDGEGLLGSTVKRGIEKINDEYLTKDLQFAPPERIVEALADTGGWNPRFDRALVPKIDAAVRRAFARVFAQEKEIESNLIP